MPIESPWIRTTRPFTAGSACAFAIFSTTPLRLSLTDDPSRPIGEGPSERPPFRVRSTTTGVGFDPDFSSALAPGETARHAARANQGQGIRDMMRETPGVRLG